MMKKIAAAMLGLSVISYQENADIVSLRAEVQRRLPGVQLVTVDEVNFRGKGSSIFVLSEGPYYYNINIFDRENGRLVARMQDSISYADNPSRKIRSIVTDDIGHDGLEEVRLLLFNGERRLYAWNGGSYIRADRSMAFRDGWDIRYKDIDGDGTEEAVVIRTPDEPELFRAYRWQRGWVPYTPKELEQYAGDYRRIDGELDALALMERRTAIRNSLLDRLR